MTITSLELELGPAPFSPEFSLFRFSCLPESLCCPSRFRLRLADPDCDAVLLEFSSLSDSMMMVSLGVSITPGVEVCEDGTDDVRDLDRDRIVSNRRWASSTGMVNNREDDPVGLGPTLDEGGDVVGGGTPGRAYSSVQCLAVLSCCFLFLTYSVAIDGTINAMTNDVSDIHPSDCGSELSALPSGSSRNEPQM